MKNKGGVRELLVIHSHRFGFLCLKLSIAIVSSLKMICYCLFLVAAAMRDVRRGNFHKDRVKVWSLKGQISGC